MEKLTWITILLCVTGHYVDGEPDYALPGGPPPTTTTIQLSHSNQPLRPPTILSPVERSHRPRTKIVESYLSSEFNFFGGGHPRSPPPPPKHHYYRLPHPNSIPRDAPPKPFEVVRAPVIYHQTVTDTDVTKALADAFDVVEKLRKPGNKIKALPQDDSDTPTITSIEFVNHYPENAPGNTATTTTTIVEAPQQLTIRQPNSQRHNYQQSQAVTLGQVTLISPEGNQQQYLAPLPSSADLPPPVVSTSAPALNNAEVIPVLPATTTSTSPATPPKLLIPSQRHVTTLAEAVQSVDPQIRTIIQPVYIPYAVDQNGRPVGPLPDYHTMDFSSLLNAQMQYLTAARSSPPIQIVQAEPQQQVETRSQPQQQPLQQQVVQYYVQQEDQNIAAAGDSSGAVPSTVPTRTRKRIGRRRKNSARRT